MCRLRAYGTRGVPATSAQTVEGSRSPWSARRGSWPDTGNRSDRGVAGPGPGNRHEPGRQRLSQPQRQGRHVEQDGRQFVLRGVAGERNGVQEAPQTAE